MKKNFLVAFKFLAIVSVALFQLFTAAAQKNSNVITTEMTNKVNTIVKPLKEQADKLLKEDASGMFKEYQNDVMALNKMKSSSEKSKASAQIREKYAAFFKNIWSNMKVDEKLYQSQIRSAFPASISERIQFQQYLNFSVIISNPAPPTPTPAPVPEPENKCVDVCAIAAGEITGEGKLIAAGAGSYGNCFLKANAWGAVAGGCNLYASLKNNISIPGTLPADSRKLRVKKSFELKQEAVAFAIGFGFAETRVSTYQTSEYMYVMAPVIFGASKTSTKTINEEYVIEKAEASKSIIKASAGTMAYLISGCWCYSDCTNIKWSICEEK